MSKRQVAMVIAGIILFILGLLLLYFEVIVLVQLFYE